MLRETKKMASNEIIDVEIKNSTEESATGNTKDYSIINYLTKSSTEKETLFLNNYKEIVSKYIADGNPSNDTLENYFGRIDTYLHWCALNKIHPLRVAEEHIIIYRDFLKQQGAKASTIYANLISLKKFYHVAQKFHFIQDNPVADVKSPRDPDASIIKFPYLTAGKLEYLLHIVPTDTEKTLRDKTMIVFMALEGLRTVEIHRMNEGDINFGQQSIFIHGKGKNGIIYPRNDSFRLLLHYLKVKDRIPLAQYGDGEIPVFTSTSRNKPGNRVDRRNIRLAIDNWLKQAGLKEPGKSAHMLRHTCATLLYKETKDLKVVQETLRHSSINMSGKYAHLMEREENRYTKNIPIEIDVE